MILRDDEYLFVQHTFTGPSMIEVSIDWKLKNTIQ